MKFAQQLVFITGASRGIGHALALAFAQAGATVIGTATTAPGAEAITEALAGQGEGVVLDVSDKAQCIAVFEMMQHRYQAPQIVVNNAGITRDNLLLRMSDEEWDAVINTHLNGLFHICKLAIKPMIKARYGRILNITSVVAAMGNPGQTNYVAAKAGMIGFTKALAQEVASRQITVNAIAPGFIATDMTAHLTPEQQKAMLAMIPAQRMGTPEDIAAAALFLASAEAAYITGQTLHVNGGMCCY